MEKQLTLALLQKGKKSTLAFSQDYVKHISYFPRNWMKNRDR